MVTVKTFVCGITRWWRHHALQTDSCRVATGIFGRPLDGCCGVDSVVDIGDATGQPAVTMLANAPIRGSRVSPDPDKDSASGARRWYDAALRHLMTYADHALRVCGALWPSRQADAMGTLYASQAEGGVPWIDITTPY